MGEPAHSKFSASAAHRWMRCPGSVVLSAGVPSKSSVYADEGTAAHVIFDRHVVPGSPPVADSIGTQVVVDGTGWEVTEEMAAAVQTAIDNAREMADGADFVLSERKVNYAGHLNVPTEHGFGRLDLTAVVSSRGELQVHDYKHGRGEIVDASDVMRVTEDGDHIIGPNPQLALYALGVYEEIKDITDIVTVVLVIHQPRAASKPSEWRLPLEDLLAWGRNHARTAAMSVLNAEALKPVSLDRTWTSAFLRPGEKQCRWCVSKATCPALREAALELPFGGALDVSTATPEDFAAAGTIECKPDIQDDEWLAAMMAKADMIEDWIKAVRAEVERRLLDGKGVPGYKIVQGKMGNRTWKDRGDAEAQLKAMRLKIEEMYDLSLISPTSAEKLVKTKVIGPRQWTKLQPLITRAEGKPHVAPVSDPRPAVSVTPVEDHFDALEDLV
jgi:hypothetical protein